ncbi:MAG: alpha/beta hydrolase [Rhodospirillaceae bacterium]|nr:alpha/beta hydrolase [Rhodospirillaceae bacterium]
MSSDKRFAQRRGLVTAGLGAGLLAGTIQASGAAAAGREREAGRGPGPDGMYAVNVNGAMWAYKDKGKGPPALFLHSFLLNSNLWTDQLNGLSDIRRCIAPDMRGWGRSEPVTDEYLDPLKYTDDVIEFLDKIGVDEPVDLVGMSVGGFICALLCERIPKRVASITLISAALDWKRDLIYERYQAEMARIAVVEGKDALFRRFDEYIDGVAPTLSNRARYKQMLLETRTEMIVKFLTIQGRTQPRPDLAAKIKVPVLLPIGSADVVITPERADAMAKQFSNAEVARIEGAGRLLSLESPEEFNKALRTLWTGRAKR